MTAMIWLAATAAALAASAPQTAPAPSRPPAAAEQAAIERSIARGRLLRAYDQAAWQGTDDLLPRLRQAGLPATIIGGWVVDGSREAPEIVFFTHDALPRILYTAQFEGETLRDGRLVDEGDESKLSDARLAMIAAVRSAREAAERAGIRSCNGRPFNTVVLPPERAGGPLLVYLMTPQVKVGELPMGGHWLVEVGTDGKVGTPQPFSRGCLHMPSQAPGEAAAMLFVAELLSPVPNEIQVFYAHAVAGTLLVGTVQTGRVWEVRRDAVLPRDDIPLPERR